MEEPELVTVDYSHADAALQILPNPPLLTSESLNWNGIQVQYHEQPAWEHPDHTNAQHVIVVHQVQQPLQIERIFDGRKQHERLIYGDVVIMPAHVSHKATWDKDAAFTSLVLEPSYLAELAHESVDSDRVELVPHFAMSDPFILHLGRQLKAELECQQQYSNLYVDSLTTALGAHLLRFYCTHQSQLTKSAGNLSPLKLRQVLEYIETHLKENIKLMELAMVAGMSLYYFSRLFKQTLGLTPYQYITQQRVERAKRLLMQSDRELADIALECGFYNQSHFTKLFRQLTGMTPKAYRNK